MPTRAPGREPSSGRAVVAGADGRIVLTYIPAYTGSESWATSARTPDGITIADAVPVVLRELAGWIVDGNDPLVTALVAAGARLRRHAALMVYDLDAAPVPAEWEHPPLPAGVRFAPVGGDPERLYAAYVGAYPPGHPDSPTGNTRAKFAAELVPLLRGEVLGPLLPISGYVVEDADPDERAVAACLVTDRPVDGPWVAEVFRDPSPRYAGTGAALLRRTLWQAAEAGLRTVGLAVTVGNPAQRVYARIGFQTISTALNCVIPGRAPSADGPGPG